MRVEKTSRETGVKNEKLFEFGEKPDEFFSFSHRLKKSDEHSAGGSFREVRNPLLLSKVGSGEKRKDYFASLITTEKEMAGFV